MYSLNILQICKLLNATVNIQIDQNVFNTHNLNFTDTSMLYV